MMGLLTIDRFIVFYPNLRYRLYITSTKVMKLIISTGTIFIATTITFSVLIAAQKINFHGLDHRIFVLFLIIDFAYIFLTVAILYLYLYIYIYIYIYNFTFYIYIYIFLACKQQSRMRKHFQSIKSKNNFNLLVLLSLIIVTFIAFIVIPNLLSWAATYGLIRFNEILFYLSVVFYKIEFLIDPLIYIFNSRLMRIICCKV